jgi:hypothetical protein
MLDVALFTTVGCDAGSWPGVRSEMKVRPAESDWGPAGERVAGVCRAGLDRKVPDPWALAPSALLQTTMVIVESCTFRHGKLWLSIVRLMQSQGEALG